MTSKMRESTMGDEPIVTGDHVRVRAIGEHGAQGEVVAVHRGAVSNGLDKDDVLLSVHFATGVVRSFWEHEVERLDVVQALAGLDAL